MINTTFPRARSLSPVLALTMAMLAGWPAAARGQADLRTATIDDLMKITVTTASRQPEDIADAPAHVIAVTARQIRTRGYRSLADLLRDQLGIKVERGSEVDYPSDVTVLGSRSSSRIVLLLDGVRVNSPTGEPLPIMANYPVHNARQVEIVFGPASALYGADAFSAVINVISMDASEAEGLSAGVTVGQFGLSNNTATYGRRFGADGSVVVSGQWYHDGQSDLSAYYPDLFTNMQAQKTGVFNTIYGPMTAEGDVSPQFQNPIGAHSFHATAAFGGVNLSLFKNRQRSSTSGPYTPDNAIYNDRAFQQNDLWVGSGSYTRTAGGVTGVSTISLSQHTLSPESGYWNVFSNLTRSYKYAHGSMAKVEQQLSWRPLRQTLLTGGATFERFFAIPQGADLNQPITARDRPGTILGTTIVDDFARMHYSNAGAYIQAQYAPGPRVSITAGTRVDFNSRYGATFNPRFGVVAKPRVGTTVKVLFGSAFLAPSPYQTSSHYGSFYSTDGGATYASDFWHLGNADLKPQKARTGQATVTQSLGPLASLVATASYAHLQGLIKHDDPEKSAPGLFHGWPVAYIEYPVNEGHQNIYSTTVDTRFLKSWSPTRRLEGRLGIGLVGGQTHYAALGPVELGAIAPLQFHGGVDAELGRWTGAASVLAFGRQRVLATTPDRLRMTLPGYAIVDVNLRRNGLTRHLDAFLRVENLFDARYLNINERAFSNPEELAGAPQEPRRLSVGIDIRLGR